MSTFSEKRTMRPALRSVCMTFAALAVSVPCFPQTDLGSLLDGPKVRVAVIGDFGARSKRPRGESDPCSESDGCKCHWLQEQAANSLYERQQSSAFDVGLTVGDNFYPCGVKDTSDRHWNCSWKRFYSRLGIGFYPTLGNHDYGEGIGCWFSSASPDAQVRYSDNDKTWNMPARYYTFRAGPVRFFALDTVKFKKDQIDWLDNALSEPTSARWKVVYGHHPVYSCSYHGDTEDLIRNLLPILKSKGVDAYISGHDHDLQYIRADGIDFFVSGGGGRDSKHRPAPAASSCESSEAEEGFKFGSKTYGFLEVEAAEEALRFEFIGQDEKSLGRWPEVKDGEGAEK